MPHYKGRFNLAFIAERTASKGLLPGALRPLVRACIIASLVVFILFMLRYILDRLVYYPMSYPQGDWALQPQVGAQDLWFTARDGVRLNAWWFPKPGSRFVTLFLHGNAGNVTHRIDHAQAINRAGSAALILDYRGYGKSKGHPSEQGLQLDADAAYDTVLQLGYESSEVVLHAESLGTAIAPTSRHDTNARA